MLLKKPQLLGIGVVGLSLLICLSGIPLLHGTFAALVISVIFQVYLPGYLLERLLRPCVSTHPIARFVWILACGLALTICIGAVARVLSLSPPVYLLILHGLMLLLALRLSSLPAEPQTPWQLTRKNFSLYALVLISCFVAFGVSYESRNRFYGFEDQSIFISLIDWIATHPDVRPQGTPIRSRQIGILNGDVRMETDGWTYIQAAWVWTSGVPARQLVWYDLGTLFIWTIPLVHFALAYELTKRESTAAWTSAVLTLAALMTLDNIVYNPSYTAYGRFVLFQINVNRQASLALILPLALMAGLTYLRTFNKTDLCITILTGLALASMHPIPTTILVLSIGVTAFLNWLAEPRWKALRKYLLLGSVLLFLMALPFVQRIAFFGLNAAPSLVDQTAKTSTALISSNIILLPNLPILGETYIRRPSSVFYSPIIILAVIIGLLFGLRWRRNLVAQYVFGTTMLAMILFFTPGVVALVDKFGSFITLLALIFILPISLTLGLGIESLVSRLSRFLSPQLAQTLASLTVLLTMFALVFEPFPISGSARDQLQTFNDMQTLRQLHPSQSALMESLGAIIQPDAITVFATPWDIANIVIEEIPGAFITGGRDQGINTASYGNERLYTNTTPSVPWLDTSDLGFIKQFGVTHIIMLADMTRLPQLLLDEDSFTLLDTTEGYMVFQVNEGTQSNNIYDLYFRMNTLYSEEENLRWGKEGFNLALPGNLDAWKSIADEWQNLLEASPENDQLRLGLAYTYVMMGHDRDALSLWATLYARYPDVVFYADALASIQQSLDPSQDNTTPLIIALESNQPNTRILAARRLLSDTFFYRLSSEQIMQVIAATEKDAITWDRLANFDNVNNVRKRVALMLDIGNWVKAGEWLESIPRPERSPEDMVADAITAMIKGDINDALAILKPTTDADWLVSNIVLHPDRWENNTAAQIYYLLQGEYARRDDRFHDAATAYQQARNYGSTLAAPYFLSQVVSPHQSVVFLNEVEAEWAKNHDTPLPPLTSLLTIADTDAIYAMNPSISRPNDEHTLTISAFYGNGRPRDAYPILSWRIQVISPNNVIKYAEIDIPAYFIDGALIEVSADVSVPTDVPELTPALVYIEPRYNNFVTAAPAIASIVLNRPKAATIPPEADQTDLQFGSDIVLRGYEEQYHPDLLDITLYWQATAPVPEDYQVFVHVLDTEGKQVGGEDSTPVNNQYPTSQWRVGISIADHHIITFDSPLPSGTYSIQVGLYRLNDGMRLPITPIGELVQDNALTVGHFTK